MKRLAIVYAGADELAARDFAFHKRNSEWGVSVGSAYSFNGNSGEDMAYVMPDVPNWHRDRIVAAYQETILVAGEEPKPKPYVKHRGRGRFYVMRGNSIVSGPHSKQEALSLIK